MHRKLRDMISKCTADSGQRECGWTTARPCSTVKDWKTSTKIDLADWNDFVECEIRYVGEGRLVRSRSSASSGTRVWCVWRELSWRLASSKGMTEKPVKER